MRRSSRCFTRLDILKHTSSSPLWKSTINWVPPNKEGHLPSTWVFLLRSELLIEMGTNMRLLSTQLLRPEVRGVEGSKAVFHNCRDFLKQRRDNLIHVSSKINDPRVAERLDPLPCPRLTTNLGKRQQVLEKHEGIGDFEMFRQTYLGSQYSESREKSHALDQTFLLPRGDGDLQKKASMVHDSTQDLLVLQLLKEVNKLKAERQAEIPDWNQPRPGLLTRRILDTLLQAKTK
ncbi:hypothetical protein ACFX13_012630 [Malus domestica]